MAIDLWGTTPGLPQSPLRLPNVVGASPLQSNGLGSWTQGDQPWYKSLTDGMFDSTGADGMRSQGWLSPALGIASGIGSLVTGRQNLKLARQQLDQNREQFNKNYAAQQQTTNTALEDRQRARVAAGGDAYESVESYMARNRIQ